VLFGCACCCAVLALLLGALLLDLPVWILPALVPSVLLCLLAGTSALAAHRLGPSGGGYTHRIHELLVGALGPRPGWRVLDAGSGDQDLAGRLSCEPGTLVVSLDTRRRPGRRRFPRGPRARGPAPVAGDLPVLPADPCRLPFSDGSFDAVVSCLVLHDGRGPAEIEQCLEEMLRVLREGGRFALLDLFGDTHRYPSIPWLEGAIRDAGGRISRRERLGERMSLPMSLDNRLALGRAGLIVGEKDTLPRP